MVLANLAAVDAVRLDRSRRASVGSLVWRVRLKSSSLRWRPSVASGLQEAGLKARSEAVRPAPVNDVKGLPGTAEYGFAPRHVRSRLGRPRQALRDESMGLCWADAPPAG